MHRALIKILVGLAVAFGLTLTAAPTVHAAPVADDVAVRAAAPSCSSQQAATRRAEARYRHAKRALRHARKALRKAKAHHASHKAVAHAKHRVKVKVRKARKAKRHVRNARSLRTTACRTTPPSSTPPVTSSSPIQSLCTARTGVPSNVCAFFGDLLAKVVPGAGTTNPIADLCTAVPQAQQLCDMLPGAAPDVTDLQAVLGQLDPAVLQDALNTLLTQLGAQDLPSADAVQGLLTTILGELGLDPADLGLASLDDLLTEVLDGLGLGGLLGLLL